MLLPYGLARTPLINHRAHPVLYGSGDDVYVAGNIFPAMPAIYPTIWRFLTLEVTSEPGKISLHSFSKRSEHVVFGWVIVGKLVQEDCIGSNLELTKCPFEKRPGRDVGVYDGSDHGFESKAFLREDDRFDGRSYLSPRHHLRSDKAFGDGTGGGGN